MALSRARVEDGDHDYNVVTISRIGRVSLSKRPGMLANTKKMEVYDRWTTYYVV